MPLRAHLRAGGAAPGCGESLPAGRGASPRGRSSLTSTSRSARRSRRISARAEQPRAHAWNTGTSRAHLRAGGAATSSSTRGSTGSGASPRGRSSRIDDGNERGSPGRISARAEQPLAAGGTCARTRAHLRAGGAAPVHTVKYRQNGGASPRGRSSQPMSNTTTLILRRISARAEQPTRRRTGEHRHRRISARAEQPSCRCSPAP